MEMQANGGHSSGALDDSLQDNKLDRSDQLLEENPKFFPYKHKKLHILKWVCIIIAALLVSAAAIVVIICTLRAAASVSDMELKLTEYLAQCQIADKAQNEPVNKAGQPKTEKFVQRAPLTSADGNTPNYVMPERKTSFPSPTVASDDTDNTKLMDFFLNLTGGFDQHFEALKNNIIRLEDSTNKMGTSIRNVISPIYKGLESTQKNVSHLLGRIDQIEGMLDVQKSSADDWQSTVNSTLSRLVNLTGVTNDQESLILLRKYEDLLVAIGDKNEHRHQSLVAELKTWRQALNSELQNFSVSILDSVNNVKNTVEEHKLTGSEQYANVTDRISEVFHLSKASLLPEINDLSDRLHTGMSELADNLTDAVLNFGDNLSSVEIQVHRLQTSLINETTSVKEEFQSEVLEKMSVMQANSTAAAANATTMLIRTSETLKNEYEQLSNFINDTISELVLSSNDLEQQLFLWQEESPVLTAVHEVSVNASQRLHSIQETLETLEEKLVSMEKEITTKDELSLCSSGNGCEVKKKTENKYRCYKAVVNGRATWDVAKKKCEALGGFLAEITDHPSLEYVKRVVAPSNTRLWLGATDKGQEGMWAWQRTGQHVAIADWYVGQPDNYDNNEHCLEINKRLQGKHWNDLLCSLKIGYICQKDADSCDGWM